MHFENRVPGELLDGSNADGLHVHDTAGLTDEAVTAAKLGYAPDAIAHVQRGSTDAESAANLAAAYAAAKSLTPGGNALSATNRALVFIPSGGYAVNSTFTLDAEYVDLCGMGGSRGTRIYGTVLGDGVVKQTARDVRLSDLWIDNLSEGQLGTQTAGLMIDTSAGGGHNDASIYSRLYCAIAGEIRQNATASAMARNCDFAGTWIDCAGGWAAFYALYGYKFRPTMYNCRAGNHGFGGEDSTIDGAILHNCIGGDECFGGCDSIGASCTAASYFYNCEAGDDSFSLGRETAGNYFNCRGGSECFGGTADGTNQGIFSGIAIGCQATGCSFGMQYYTAGEKNSYMSGRLERCRLTNALGIGYLPLKSGSVVRHCTIEKSAESTDGWRAAIKLLENGAIIDGSYIKPSTGGDSIASDSPGQARTAQITRCTLEGDLSADVTNTIGDGSAQDGGCVVTSQDALPGDGLVRGANGALAVNPDDSTIEINSDALRVKDGGITNAKIAADAAIDRSKLAQDSQRQYSIPLYMFKKANGLTELPAAGDGTNMGLAAAGCGAMQLQTTVINGNHVIESARTLFALPPEYVGGTMAVRVHVQCPTVNGEATLDVVLKKCNREGGASPDRISTDPQDINGQSWDNEQFYVANLNGQVGDILDIGVSIDADDTGGSAGASALIGAVELLLNIKG